MPCEKLIKNSVVKVSSTLGLVLLIIDIVLPGIGTMLSSVCGDKVNCDAFIVGLL